MHTLAHQNVAEFLNDTLGDLLDEIAFADLVDDVVANLEAAAERHAEERVA